MKALISCAIALALCSPALAHPCDDGTGPEGWYRDGGYCEIRNDLQSVVGDNSPTVCFDFDPEPSTNDECPPAF